MINLSPCNFTCGRPMSTIETFVSLFVENCILYIVCLISRHKRYFRIFYPVVQLPSKAATPGPGQYDIVKYETLKLPKSSSMFVSSTNRCAKTAFNGPGPGIRLKY